MKLLRLKQLCVDNVDGWDGAEVGGEFQEGGAYVYLWLIHADMWQKPTLRIVMQLSSN